LGPSASFYWLAGKVTFFLDSTLALLKLIKKTSPTPGGLTLRRWSDMVVANGKIRSETMGQKI
jgi:hypothetical protein